MTDRRTIDQINSDQLDQLYDERDRYEEVQGDMKERAIDLTRRAERAEAALTRIRKAIDSVKATGHGHTPTTPYDKGAAAARDWVAMRVLEAIDARIVHEQPAPSSAATEATEPHTGLVIEPYRNDRHENVWVFRCWGTDTCDGWLSLDHPSKQSAERARDRHIAEDHQAEQPARTTPNNPPTSAG